MLIARRCSFLACEGEEGEGIMIVLKATDLRTNHGETGPVDKAGEDAECEIG